jgi:polyhydroxybutyrate depolymerase
VYDRGVRVVLLLAVLAVVSCGRDHSTSGSTSARGAPSVVPLILARPFELHAPAKHDARAPLLVLLHGFGGDHEEIAGAFGARELADAHGFYLALPDGMLDPNHHRFWNASDACCDFHDLHVDDVAYLDAILDDVMASQPIDPKRVYVAGFSNGGFMAHRYACERADRVAAIVSLSGDPWKDASLCKPSAPVSVLAVHGDADEVVAYGGGRLYDMPAFHSPAFARAGAFPAVKDGVAMWARLDGCAASTTTDDGREEDLRSGACSAGTDVQLWTRHGATHSLGMRREDLERVWSFLAGHAKK